MTLPRFSYKVTTSSICECGFPVANGWSWWLIQKATDTGRSLAVYSSMEGLLGASLLQILQVLAVPGGVTANSLAGTGKSLKLYDTLCKGAADSEVACHMESQAQFMQ